MRRQDLSPVPRLAGKGALSRMSPVPEYDLISPS